MNWIRKLKIRKIERQVDRLPELNDEKKEFYADISRRVEEAKRTVTDSTATTITVTEAEDG